jgi:hypothetical protein
MPEPVTIALAGATAVTVAVYLYKTVERVTSAPKEIVQTSGDSIERIIKTFSEEFRKLVGSEPQLVINRTVIQRGGQEICELALYKETIEIQEQWENTRFASKKSLTVKQPFTLKAGFDLNRLKFKFDPQNKTVIVTISDSLLVNLEHVGPFEFLKEEHGFLNRITSADRDRIANSLPQKAREEAEVLQLREKAIAQLKLFLTRFFPDTLTLEFHSNDDTLWFENRTLHELPKSSLDALGLVQVKR